MSATLTNFGVADTLQANDTVRVTFIERHPMIETDNQFASDFAKVFANLKIGNPKQSRFWSLNPNTAAPGMTTAVQDLRMFEAQTGSNLLAVLDDLCGTWVVVDGAKKLIGSDAADATTTVGEQQRSAVAAGSQEKQDASPGLLGDIGKAFGTYLGAVKWLAIGAVVLGVAWAVTTTENKL